MKIGNRDVDITAERLLSDEEMRRTINEAIGLSADGSSLLHVLYHVNALTARLAQAYQVIGALAAEFGVFGHPEIGRALDNAACGDTYHPDLLPWPKEPLKLSGYRIAAVEWRLVPAEAQPEMLAKVLPDTSGLEAPDEADRKTITEALFLLGEAPESAQGDGAKVAFALLHDYRLMVAAAPTPDVETMVDGCAEVLLNVDGETCGWANTTESHRNVLRHSARAVLRHLLGRA